MKTILDVKDDTEFLRIIYNSIDQIGDLVNKVGVNEIRSRLPELSTDDSDEEKKAKIYEQSKQNMMDLMKGFLLEYPTETVNLLHSLIILEKGEEYPHGFDLLAVSINCICDERVMSFFISLARLNALK